MSLLEELRQDNSGHPGTNQRWAELPDLLIDSIPEYKHIKTILIRGETIVLGCVKNHTHPRYLYAVMHSARTAMDPARSKSFSKAALLGPRPTLDARPIAMGVSRYRADAETNYYTDPWVAWITPAPQTLTAWVHHIMTTTTEDTPAMERGKLERRR